MSAASRRGARREQQLALVLGTNRVHRQRGESAPDVEPLRLPDGRTLTLECKSRLRPLATVARWMQQCEGYAAPGAPCAVVVFAKGQHRGDALVVLRLRDLESIVRRES